MQIARELRSETSITTFLMNTNEHAQLGDLTGFACLLAEEDFVGLMNDGVRMPLVARATARGLFESPPCFEAEDDFVGLMNDGLLPPARATARGPFESPPCFEAEDDFVGLPMDRLTITWRCHSKAKKLSRSLNAGWSTRRPDTDPHALNAPCRFRRKLSLQYPHGKTCSRERRKDRCRDLSAREGCTG